MIQQFPICPRRNPMTFLEGKTFFFLWGFLTFVPPQERDIMPLEEANERSEP